MFEAVNSLGTCRPFALQRTEPRSYGAFVEARGSSGLCMPEQGKTEQVS